MTSDNLNQITRTPPRTTSLAVEQEIRLANRHIKEVELDSHGYSVVDLTPERVQFDTFFLSDREDPQSTQSFYRGFQSKKGSRTVVPAATQIPLDRAR